MSNDFSGVFVSGIKKSKVDLNDIDAPITYEHDSSWYDEKNTIDEYIDSLDAGRYKIVIRYARTALLYFYSLDTLTFFRVCSVGSQDIDDYKKTDIHIIRNFIGSKTHKDVQYGPHRFVDKHHNIKISRKKEVLHF